MLCPVATLVVVRAVVHAQAPVAALQVFLLATSGALLLTVCLCGVRTPDRACSCRHLQPGTLQLIASCSLVNDNDSHASNAASPCVARSRAQQTGDKKTSV